MSNLDAEYEKHRRYRKLFNGLKRELSTHQEVTLARGSTEGTEFRILLSLNTEREQTLVFACPGGAGQNNAYELGEIPAHRLIALSAGPVPSVNFAQVPQQKPLEAVVWCTLAQGNEPCVYKEESWRSYYYSIHCAAIGLLIQNGYKRIHTASLARSNYQSGEVKLSLIHI